MFRESSRDVGVFGGLSRRGYWIAVGLLMVLLVAVTWGLGGYAVGPAGAVEGARVTRDDPVAQLMYSPVGTVVVAAVLQFLAANVLLALGAWGWRRVRLITRRPAEG